MSQRCALSLVLVFFSFLISSTGWSYIPRASMILSRTCENTGRGFYQIEQEVQFPNGPDNLILKETWLIENENNMKVVVTGTKELKETISFSIQIANGVHRQNGQNSKSTHDFIEKYFHIRTADSYAQTLSQLRLAPANVMAAKNFRSVKDIEHQPENFLRLSRVGGSVSYAFGIPSSGSAENPGFWFEQDQFFLRKFRLPSGVEVSADRFSTFSRGLMFPRTRTVSWDNHQVTIQTISVVGRGKDSWASFGTKVNNRMDGLQTQAAAGLVEEFYKRFR